MKVTTAIFFLLFLIVSQVGHPLMYYVQLWHIKNLVKEEITAGVPESLCNIIEDNEQLSWEEAGEEFSLNGDMYDVVTIKKYNGRTYLYCLKDKNEEQLLQKFTGIMSSASGHEKGKTNPATLRFHITDQYIVSAVQALPIVHFETPRHRRLKTALSSCFREIHIPPPWNPAYAHYFFLIDYSDYSLS